MEILRPGALEYAGVTDFPRPDFFAKESTEKRNLKREAFYKYLSEIVPEGVVYYPGSGADPVPFKFFGEQIIYGSIMETHYFRMLRDGRVKKPSAYTSVYKGISGLKSLRGVWADFNKSPFPDSSFKVIIFNGIPVEPETTIKETKRLLSRGGLVVFEDVEDLKILKKAEDAFLGSGFTGMDIGKFGNLTYISYWVNYLKGTDIVTNSARFGAGRKQFLDELKNGNPVKMEGHKIMVFGK